MRLDEARTLDAQGKLKRKVLTEQGWYLPRYTESTAPDTVAGSPPPPLILPPRRGRKTKEK
ncbi:MAG: hypothetical protein FJ191_14310 [Gammaproteobacteria bacterium]|nr:hypothetical protein [Gammaproteobacteria bacterium]